MQKIEAYIRWISIPIVAFIPYFFATEEDFIKLGFWTHWLNSLIFTATYWNLAVWIFMAFRRKYRDYGQTRKRVILTWGTIAAMVIVVTPLLQLILGLNTFENVIDPKFLLNYIPVSMFITLMVGSIYESVFYFDQWKESVQLAESLKNQQIRTQFEVLQNQMSPHFLFNSLNTLTTLIAENPNTAIDFTQKLSDVYRYILQNKEKELVTLHEEWGFAQDYLYLLGMRYPDNLKVKFDVDDEYMDRFIAPLTLQILIENAIKHNVVSKSHPLTIEIYMDKGDSIMVKNNIKPKQALEKSTKTGLANIRRRYEYLGNKKIDVIQTVSHFMVAIPLIELTGALESQKKQSAHEGIDY